MLKECFDKYAPANIEKVSGSDIREGKKALMSMIGESAPSKKRGVRPLVIAAAGLAAASALTVSVGAANDWSFEKLIAGFYPTAAESREQMADAAQKLDGMMYQAKDCVTTSTFEKYDVTMGDYIFNGKSVLVSVDFRAKDGTPFEDVEATFLKYPDDPTKKRYYQCEQENLTIDGKSIYSGGGINWDVLEDGTLRWTLRMDLWSDVEITEPTKAEFSMRELKKGTYMQEALAKQLAVDKADLLYDESTFTYYLIDENGGRKEYIQHTICDSEPYYICKADYEEMLDDGTFTAELILNPVGEARSFTLSDGKHNADVKITAAYAEIALKYGFTAGGEDCKTWSNLMWDAMFIYDADGNIMLSPDDYDKTGAATGGGGGMDSIASGFPKPIDVEKIGAVRIGAYTFGDVPPIDYEKYPYIRDYYGITE